MIKTSFVLTAALALAAFGCNKSAGGGDCAKAVDNTSALAKADMAKMPGMTDQTLAKLHDLAVQHCKDDKWAGDAIKCMVDAKTETDAQACFGKLTAEQQQKMNTAAMDAMKSAAPAAPAAPPAQ